MTVRGLDSLNVRKRSGMLCSCNECCAKAAMNSSTHESLRSLTRIFLTQSNLRLMPQISCMHTRIIKVWLDPNSAICL